MTDEMYRLVGLVAVVVPVPGYGSGLPGILPTCHFVNYNVHLVEGLNSVPWWSGLKSGDVVVQ